MSVAVKFNEVGRNKVSWKESLPAANEALILRCIKKRGVLMSERIEVEISDDGKSGTIFVGGFRLVGRFEIVQMDHKQEAQ